VHDQIAAMDIHIGDPGDVMASLRTDTTLARATDLTVSVAFDRSAALIHPAVDRTGRRRGGAGAGLGAERRGRAARRVTAGKEAHDWVFGMRDRRGTYFPKTIFRKLMYPLSRKAISTVPKLAHWTPFAFVIDSFLVRTPNYAIRHCD